MYKHNFHNEINRQQYRYNIEKRDMVLSTDPDVKAINIRPLNNIFFSFDLLNQAKKIFLI